MKIAIDVAPIIGERSSQHRVRGSGFYIENLKRSLIKYFPENTYSFFTRGEKLPKDIDLVHYPYFESFFLTLPLHKRFRTIVTVHDLIPLIFPQHFPSGIRGKIKWQLQKFALQRSDGVITDSESSKKDVVSFTGIPDTKVHRIYLAASEAFKSMKDTLLLDRIRVKYRLPQKFVLYVGDVTWNKNLPRLVEAIKKINLPLVLVGKALAEKHFDTNNPWNQDLVQVHKLIDRDGRVIRLGFVPTDHLVGIYNLATILAMPSLYEGFGLPALEAMACGTPVVTSNEGSLREVVGRAGYVVDAYSVDGIANGIKDVYFNEELKQELRTKGFLQARNFSWKKTVEQTVEVYKRVLDIRY